MPPLVVVAKVLQQLGQLAQPKGMVLPLLKFVSCVVCVLLLAVFSNWICVQEAL